jgi:hypothetical protein
MQLTGAQSRLLPLLEERLSVQEITARLDWRRQRYSVVLGELATLGLLRGLGELPADARAETFPSHQTVEATLLGMQMVGLSEARAVSELSTQARAGIVPPSAGARYSQWTGFAVRRVSYTWASEQWVIQGHLSPRYDGAHASRYTPQERLVEVLTSPSDSRVWRERRGLIVPQRMISDLFGLLSLDEQVALTMCVAWVMETRALIDAEALTKTTVLAGRDE